MLIVRLHLERSCTRVHARYWGLHVERSSRTPRHNILGIRRARVQRARFMVHRGATRASRVRVRSIWAHSGNRERSVSSWTVRARSPRADGRVRVRTLARNRIARVARWNSNGIGVQCCSMSTRIHVNVFVKVFRAKSVIRGIQWQFDSFRQFNSLTFWLLFGAHRRPNVVATNNCNKQILDQT